MKAYVFFSVHEELFHRIAEVLKQRGIDAWSGFVWGEQQAKALADRDVVYDPLVIFTRDLLPKCDDGRAPDLDWLLQREQELGVSIQRMLTSERHLLEGRTFEQIMRMAEVALREISAAYDRIRPDVVISSDVACFHTYVHFVLARERGIPFWTISSGRMPKRVSVFASGLGQWEHFQQLFAEIRARGLRPDERKNAEDYLTSFVEKPAQPTGMKIRGRKPRVGLGDVSVFRDAAKHYLGDRQDPTAISPLRVIQQRLERIARVAAADAKRVFESPVPGENYVFYPIHFQPEASTLVQAPLYLDQVALLRDIAASLPIGYRLYVKEHVSNRGRRPLAFYEAIRAIPAVRLLGPDANTWSLIRDARAIAVITGTVGWEGLLFDKQVVTFGEVFFNVHPSVYRASQVPKDGWYDVFRRATTTQGTDREATLAMISSLQQASHPGFIGNTTTFPATLDPENVASLADALAREMRLGGPEPQARYAGK